MPAPRFITSESQMGAPGVYVKENAPAVPTRGQRNRVIGFAGKCLRGPVGKLVFCDDYRRFLDVFGGRDRAVNGGTRAGDVWAALQGRRWGKIAVARVAAAAAVAASFNYETAAGGGGTEVLKVTASSVGLWGNDVKGKVTDATNGDVDAFNFVVKLYGVVKTYQNLKIKTSTDDNLLLVVGSDDANWIVLTKLANGRPINNAPSTDGADADGFVSLGQTVSGYTSVAGTDGSIADSDYIATGGPMDMINDARGIHACAVVGRSNTALKTYVDGTLAPRASQRVWFVCPDDATVLYTAAITERATLDSDRESYWFNHGNEVDPVTQATVSMEPFLSVLSILSQTDPDVHPGDFDNAVYTRAVRSVTFELSDPIRDALDKGGVSFIWRDQDDKGNDVVIPGNALTCDFDENNQDLDGRYMKDFILNACANRIRGDQFKGNTPSNRAARAGAISSFLEGLARSDRYILRSESGVPQFSYVNNSSVNSPSDQTAGDQHELLIATLIPKVKRALLNATIGVDAVISEQ
jgi:hypothetical protein